MVTSVSDALQDCSGRDAACGEQANNTGLVVLMEQHLKSVVWFQREFAKELSTDSPYPDSTEFPGLCVRFLQYFDASTSFTCLITAQTYNRMKSRV